MACSNRNLLYNGGFRKGTYPWTGNNAARVKNPLDSSDYAIYLDADINGPGVLKQIVKTKVERSCAYYCYFRVLNVTRTDLYDQLYATVSYLDYRKKTITSTALHVIPPKTVGKWFSYFSIVPPPPANTKYVALAFYLPQGQLYVDYVSIASHKV